MFSYSIYVALTIIDCMGGSYPFVYYKIIKLKSSPNGEGIYPDTDNETIASSKQCHRGIVDFHTNNLFSAKNSEK